jgi:hypothetical protein
MLSTFVTFFLTVNPVVVPVTPTQVLTPTGAVKLELGTLSAPLGGDLVLSVRQWALAHGDKYGLPAGSTLVSSEAFSTQFGASFHLLQTVRGHEVYAAKLVVTLDDLAQVTQVASSLESATRVLDTWTLSHDQAMAKASKAVELALLAPSGVPYGGAKQYLFRVGDELRAGWLANVKTADFTKNFYVGVDAISGAVLFVQNRVHHDKLDANVYPVSPGGLDAGVGATPTVVRRLVFADGGSMVGDECNTPLEDGGLSAFPNDAGELCGTQLMSYNCCPTEGCDVDAGMKRFSGSVDFMGFPVKVNMPICDRLRRASNVTNDAGTYQYTPVDPPANKAIVDGKDPANSDQFAEVHSFYHVNGVYEWMRGLSRKGAPIFGSPTIAPFKMRDEKRSPALRPAVWSNFMFPNFQEVFANPACAFSPAGCMVNTLLRVDNAAFFPRENFSQLPVPGLDTGVDTLMIFQGNAADAAYDATVIQHEFGHGAIYATANLTFSDVALDARSANNEGGALHEGFADYIAAAYNNLAGVGPYFGPRALAGQATVPGVSTNSYLRTMENTFTCPEVLWGEVHQDSQHVAAALWKGRTGPFVGTDSGATFDAAFYAMLVSITPNADFAMVAQVMAAKVGVAFPSVANAATQMTQIFKDKGVIECSKVVDVTGATQKRPYYGIPAAANMANALVPGPYQLKVNAPMGAKAVRISGMVQGGGLGGQAPAVTALVKYGAPITFTAAGAALNNDATITSQLANGVGTIAADAGCGSAVYVSLASIGGGATLQAVEVKIDPLTSCTVDAGQPDAGHEVTLPVVTSVEGPPAKTCGCSALDASLVVAALGLLSLRRRRS